MISKRFQLTLIQSSIELKTKEIAKLSEELVTATECAKILTEELLKDE